MRFPAVGQSASRAPSCGRARSKELLRRPLLKLGQQRGCSDAVPQPRRGEDEALIPVGFKHDKVHRQLRSDGGAALRPGTVLPDTRLAWRAFEQNNDALDKESHTGLHLTFFLAISAMRPKLYTRRNSADPPPVWHCYETGTHPATSPPHRRSGSRAS